MDQSKMAEVRIMQLSPQSIAQSVYSFRAVKFNPEILTASSGAVASNKGGVGETSYFL